MARIVRFPGRAARRWRRPWAGARRAGRLERGWLVAAALFLAPAVGWLLLSGTATRLVEPAAVERAAGEDLERISARFTLCREARGSCVVDGDTFDHEGTRYRIADIDTPEVFSPRCPAEKALGERATRRLLELLNAAPFELRRSGRDADRYERKLRVVTRDGRSVGEVLVAEGMARAWDGARRGWC